MHENLKSNIEKAGINNSVNLKAYVNDSESVDQTAAWSYSQVPTPRQNVKLFDKMNNFEKEKFPLEVLRKMKELDREKDSFSQQGKVYDRLYMNSVLKPLVQEEKALLVKDLEANRWVKTVINEGNLLCRHIVI